MAQGWLTAWDNSEDNRCLESVPSFVPTTKPYQVLPSVRAALGGLSR